MLAAALEAEVDAYLAEFVDERDEDGHRRVTRNGHARSARSRLDFSGWQAGTSQVDSVVTAPSRRPSSQGASHSVDHHILGPRS
jgi:hypothetical protein